VNGEPAADRPDRGWRPANVPLRVGLVGLGNIGLGHHVPALLAMPDLVRVVAVADPSEERRALAIDALGLEREAAHDAPEELVGRDDIDVVDLATPPGVRTALALAAIARGHAVLAEKPIATVPADADRVVGASAASRVPFGMVHNYVWLPELVAAVGAIADGSIGRPEVAILNYLGVEDRPGSRAWRPDWRHDPSLAGGGVLMDMLHVVYVAEALLGRAFERVSAELIVRSDDAPVEDVAVCRFETDGAIALVNVGGGAGPGGITVSGSDGRIEIRYRDGGTGPFAPLESVRVVRRGGEVVDRTPPLDAGQGAIDVHLVETFRVFFDRLVAGESPAATAVDGLRVLEATLGAYASAATGRPVTLPLATDDPIHLRGIAGLAELPLAPRGTIARHGVFGVGGPGRGA
jgi:predicted dehydrogenase